MDSKGRQPGDGRAVGEEAEGTSGICTHCDGSTADAFTWADNYTGMTAVFVESIRENGGPTRPIPIHEVGHTLGCPRMPSGIMKDKQRKVDRFQKACHYYAKAQQDGTWRNVYAIGREAGLRSWALYQGGDSSRFDELYNSLLNNQDHFLSQDPLKRIERSVQQGRFKTLPASLKHLSKEGEE